MDYEVIFEALRNVSPFIGAIVGGSIPLTVMIIKEKTKQKYKLHKEGLSPNIKDISEVTIPPILSTKISKEDIENRAIRDFYEIIDKFTEILEENFDAEDLQNYYKNLQSLKIRDRQSIGLHNFLMNIDNVSGLYSGSRNTIEFVDEEAITHELFHVASTADKDYVGFSQKKTEVGLALNEGYTELLNRRYFPEKNRTAYVNQQIVAKYIENIIGQKEMEKMYLNSNLLGVIDELKKLSSEHEIMKFLANIDYVLIMEELSNKKDLKRVEEKRVKQSQKEICDFVTSCTLKKFKSHCLDGTYDETFSKEVLENTINLINLIEHYKEKNNVEDYVINRLKANLVGPIAETLSHPVSDLLTNAIGNSNLENIYDKYGMDGIKKAVEKYSTKEETEQFLNKFYNVSKQFDEIYDDIPMEELYELENQYKEIEKFSMICDIKRAIEEFLDNKISNDNFNERLNYYCYKDFNDDLIIKGSIYIIKLTHEERIKILTENFKDNNLVIEKINELEEKQKSDKKVVSNSK